jgi:hypothetical protein
LHYKCISHRLLQNTSKSFFNFSLEGIKKLLCRTEQRDMAVHNSQNSMTDAGMETGFPVIPAKVLIPSHSIA